MMKLYLTLLCLFILTSLSAQTRFQIKGVIRDQITNEVVPFATVVLQGTTSGAIADSLGRYKITNVQPGMYRVEISTLGYKAYLSPQFQITTYDYTLDVKLEESNFEIGDVTVKRAVISKTTESPVSLNVVSIKEIEKSPGANRDISRVITSLPGVGGSAGGGYRNDLLVRGGGPGENRFFLDGIEIPNINHFSTQGASGGPVGIIDADLVREVDFYSGAFPANRGNALSSVMNFNLKDGNAERQIFRATVGASEVAFSANGHIGKNTTYIASVRRSYLQFLFQMIGLPLLPNFTDVQFKVKHKIAPGHEITLIGLGALDDMTLNDGIDEDDAKNQYLVGYLPIIKQNSYTIGAVYRHFRGRHSQSVILSNSFMNNRNDKFLNNDESKAENRTLKYSSDEIEYHLKAEHNSKFDRIKISGGANTDYTIYRNSTYQKIFAGGAKEVNYNTDLSLFRWGAFVSANYESPSSRFKGALGVRMDANNASNKMSNPLTQLSPRISASYSPFDHFFINGSLGRYYQLPAYTTLGYKNREQELINLNNGAKYIRSDQAVLGFEYNVTKYARLTLEGFYKKYANTPVSISDNIPLSSKGVDYGVSGAEEANFNGHGRAYGFELMYRLSGLPNIYATASYTYFRSEFKASKSASYLPSAWDNNHLLTLVGSYTLKRNWEVGVKFRLAGAAPYTPYDVDKSSLVDAWNATGRPYLDYSQYNNGRLSTFTQLDIRVDKSYYFKGWMLGFYVGIENLLNTKYKENDILLSTGVLDPATSSRPIAEQRYIMQTINNNSGTIIPTIGIVIEF